MPSRHIETRNIVFPKRQVEDGLYQHENINLRRTKSMSSTIEAIMRHMAPTESCDRSKQQSREAGKGNHDKKAALHLVGIEVRAHHAPVSFQCPSRLQWNGSRRQKRPGPDDAGPAGRDKGVDPYRRTRCGSGNARCRSIHTTAL